MRSLSIRNLDDDVYEGLRRRAAEKGRSLEAEARAALAEALRRPAFDQKAFAAELRRRALARSGGRIWKDSTVYIRKDRDSR